MKFKIDENLPVEAAELLREQGHDAMTVGDQNLAGEIDPTIISVCSAEDRAFVTLDLDFSDIRAYPPKDYCGIIVLRPSRQAKDRVLNTLRRAIGMFGQEELEGRLWSVTEAKIRIHGDN